MGVFSINAITDRGRNLLADVQAGAVFIPTRIVMGSGYLPSGYTAASLTGVVSPVTTLDVSKWKRTADGKVIFGGVYKNDAVATDFYFRELALFARAEYRDANGNVTSSIPECLYSYGNAADSADLMPAYSTGTVVERNIDLVTWAGNNAKVELTVESGVSVNRDEFDEHAGRHSKDGEDPITPEMIGAVSSHGVVPGDDLIAWAENQAIGGAFLVSPSTTKNVPSASWYIGNIDVADGGKRIWMTDMNTHKSWENHTVEGVFSGWVEGYNTKNPPEKMFTVPVSEVWQEDSTNGGYFQSVNVSGILGTDYPIADVVLGADVAANALMLAAWGCISKIETSNGTVTLYANGSKPGSAFTMRLKVVR